MTKAVLFLLLFAMPLAGQEKSKVDLSRHIDFTQQLVGLDGKPLTGGDPRKPEPITLSDVAVNALENSLDEDKQMSGSRKFQLDQLARKIYHNKDVVLSVEDTALIKDRIGKAYGPLIVGACWRLLDPSTI